MMGGINVWSHLTARRCGTLLTAIVMCLPLAVVTTATPAAADPGDYRFENVNSNLCLDVVDWGSYNGANVQQWGCWDGTPQLWSLSNGIWAAGPDGQYDTYFQVKNRTTGRCLDVAGVSQAENANVHVWDCIGAPNRADQRNQRWAIGFWYGTVTLRALHSSKCLQVYASSRDYRGNVVQGTCPPGRFTGNQLWYSKRYW
jgi:hypothetical protein